MSPLQDIILGERGCFPRVSGDEPGGDRLNEGHDLFSPRERG